MLHLETRQLDKMWSKVRELTPPPVCRASTALALLPSTPLLLCPSVCAAVRVAPRRAPPPPLRRSSLCGPFCVPGRDSRDFNVSMQHRGQATFLLNVLKGHKKEEEEGPPARDSAGLMQCAIEHYENLAVLLKTARTRTTSRHRGGEGRALEPEKCVADFLEEVRDHSRRSSASRPHALYLYSINGRARVYPEQLYTCARICEKLVELLEKIVLQSGPE